MNTKTIKTLFPFLILLAFLAYNLEAGIENSFPNGAMVLDASNHADNALGNLGAYSKAEVNAIVATPTAEIAAHAASNSTHGCTIIASEARITDAIATHAALSATHNCTVIASEAAIAAHAALSTAHNATTLASEAYITGYAAKLAGDAAQDFSVATLTVAHSIISGNTIRIADNFRLNLGYNQAGGASIWYDGNGDTYFEPRTGYNHYFKDTEVLINASDSGDFKLQVGGNASFSGDVRATSFTLGGNLKTGSNWISGDGDNEGIYVNASGEVLIATSTDAGDYKLQVNGNAYVSGTIQGAHVASDTTAGISTVVYLATQTMTFKDGLLVSVTNP